jgi:hypothetical protein
MKRGISGAPPSRGVPFNSRATSSRGRGTQRSYHDPLPQQAPSQRGSHGSVPRGGAPGAPKRHRDADDPGIGGSGNAALSQFEESKRARHTSPPSGGDIQRLRQTQQTGDIQRLRQTQPTREQLVTDEALLRPAQAGELARQRRRQQHSLYADARLNPLPLATTLEMARNNVLAHLNGYGGALAFLDPANSPDANLTLLDGYMHHLWQGLVPGIPQEMRDRAQRRVELACHYLVKTSLFDGAPLRPLAHIANKLSKSADSVATRAAITWIAQRVVDKSGTDGTLAVLSGRQLALLAGAFAKVDNSTTRAALIAIDGSVASNPWLLDSHDARGLSTLLKSLSKPQTHGACPPGAAAVFDRLLRSPRHMADLDAQGVANTLTALSKWWTDPAATQAAGGMATHLRTSGLVQRMDSLPFTQSLNALGKLCSDPACLEGARAMAERLVREPSLSQGMSGRQLAEVLMTLAKLPSNPPYTTAASVMAHCVDRATADSLDEHSAVSVLRALARWPDDPSCGNALRTMASRISQDGALAREIDLDYVSNVLIALSKFPEDPLCTGAARALVRARLDDPAVDDWTGVSVALALHALSRWRDDPDFAAGAAKMARHLHVMPGKVWQTDARQLAQTVNALSKWPTNDDCRAALRLAAARLRADPQLIARMDDHTLATLINGLAKFTDEADCRWAIGRVARQLDDGLVLRLDERGFGNILNALSKCPDDADCAAAVRRMAARLCNNPGLVPNMSGAAFFQVLNGLSKWPGDPACTTAARQMASRIEREPGLAGRMSGHHIGGALNALSKWPGDPHCAAAARALAGQLRADTQQLWQLDEQQLCLALNALSKWPDDGDCAAAASALAVRIDAGLAHALPPEGVAIGLSALSKWSADAQCAAAARTLAERVCTDAELPGKMAPEDLAAALHGLVAFADDDRCAAAARLLAARVDTALVGKLDGKGVASTLTALAKLPDDPACKAAAQRLVERLRDDEALVKQMGGLDITVALYALSGGADDEAWLEAAEAVARRVDAALVRQMPGNCLAGCLASLGRLDGSVFRDAAMLMAQPLGRGSLPWNRFDDKDVSRLALALGRLGESGDGSDELSKLATMRLRSLAHHLQCSGRLERAGPQAIGSLLKSLHHLQLHREMAGLAPQTLARLEDLRASGALREENLETLAHLCVSLLPLARSPELKPHRPAALRLLDQLHETVRGKVDAFLQDRLGGPPTAGASGTGTQPMDIDAGPFHTACPSLSLHQVLKTYESVSTLLNGRNLGGHVQRGSDEDAALRQRREQIGAWCSRVQQRADALIQAGLGSRAWNLAMRVESESVIGSTDRYLIEHAEEIKRLYPPAQFDVQKVFDDFPDEPGMPGGDTGMVRIPVVDMGGKQLDPGELQYSLLAHLTENKVKFAWVQLPGPVTPQLLEGVIHIDGEPYVMNWAGGSKAKSDSTSVEDIFADDPSLPRHARKDKRPGKLLAVRYSDLAPGAPFNQLAQDLMGDWMESWWYWQRLGFASQPSLDGIGTHGHVLQLKNKTFSAWTDRPQDVAHPLVLRDREGREVRLKPHDGSMVVPMSWFRMQQAEQAANASTSQDAEQPPQEPALLPAVAVTLSGKVQVYGEKRDGGNVPSQALQHYPRSGAVAQERLEHMKAQLDAEEETPIEGNQGALRFRQLTTGELKGASALAGNSSDRKLYLSSVKSAHIKDPAGGVMVGRSPYNKPNIRTFKQEEVVTDPNDPTVRFLDTVMSAQYSMIVRREKPDGKPVLQFHKGKLYVVPDEYFPPGQCRVHYTVENEKTNKAPKVDAAYNGQALMVLTDTFAPGSEYLLPVKSQEDSEGDVDGDHGVIVGDSPALFALVDAQEQQRLARPEARYKPGRTKTPARDEQGNYLFGRTERIIDALGKLMPNATMLLMRYKQLTPQEQHEVAEWGLFGGYEGTEPQLKRDVRAALAAGPDAGTMTDLIQRAHADVQKAQHPTAREVAHLLERELRALAEEPDGGDSGEEGASPQAGDETQPRRRDAVALSERTSELFPELDAALDQAENAQDRVLAVLNKYPQRLEKKFDGYVPGDPEASMDNFLGMAIAAGTDSFKSDTDVKVYEKRHGKLVSLMNEVAPDSQYIAYSKARARDVHRGIYDHERIKQVLAGTQNVMASVMPVCGDELLRRGKLQLGVPHRPVQHSGDAPDAGVLRQAAVQREPAVSADVEKVAALGGVRRDAGRTVRSHQSLASEITGGREHGLRMAKVPTALRYVIEYPAVEFTRRCKQAMTAFEDMGYAPVKVDNAFLRHDPMYLGVTLTLETPDGYRFDTQFHTPQSYVAKSDLHDTHKMLQQERYGGQPDRERVRQLEHTLRQRCLQVPPPPEVGDITTWFEDPMEGVAAMRDARRAKPSVAVTPARSRAEQARVMEPEVTPKIYAAAASAGAQVKGNAHFQKGRAGQPGRVVEATQDPFLKSVESIKTKIKRVVARTGVGASEAAAQVNDAVRYAMVWPTDGFSAGVARAMANLEGQGFQVLRWNNFFVDGDGTYKGINAVIADEEGRPFELQMHTEESFAAKVENHLPYKKASSATDKLYAGAEGKKADALHLDLFLQQERMQSVTRSVTQPTGIEALTRR